MADFIYSGKARFPAAVKPLMTPLDQVTQFDGNPNNGALDEIIDSIKHNGFTTVITVDANSRQIVSGNHRWQALHALGATEAPMVFVDYESPEEAKRILVADNRTGQLARPDDSALLDILMDLRKSDIGLQGTGYDETSFTDLLMEVNASQEMDLGGGGGGPALFGIHEVVVAFDDENERDEFYAEMAERYDSDNVRTVDV